MQNIKKYFMTLVALLAVTTGAWATDETLLTTITPTGDGTYSETTAGAVTVTPAGSFFYSGSYYGWRWDYYGSLTVTANEGYTIARCVFIQQGNNQSVTISEAPFALNFEEFLCYENSSMDGVTSIEVYGFAPAASPSGPEVAWDKAKKTGTFTMPGSDVVLTPQYAPAAQWAKVENVDQLPTAIEGIYAGTTDAIVNAGAVATGQGTVMYAVTSTNQATAPELSAFSATLPTAENIADEGADVLIWYYIQGADTPDGQEATAENTFNDSEICTTPLQVTVLTNKFDITLNAANANTIEAGKATVTVGGTAATVTEGKLQGVKMGSEVKLEAKPGYKFRKVEVKKAEAKLPKYADVVKICDIDADNNYLISSFFDGTNANFTTITKEEAIALAEYLGGGNIRVVYEEYEFYGDRYVRSTNAAGKDSGATLSTANYSTVPLYYVPASN